MSVRCALFRHSLSHLYIKKIESFFCLLDLEVVALFKLCLFEFFYFSWLIIYNDMIYFFIKLSSTQILRGLGSLHSSSIISFSTRLLPGWFIWRSHKKFLSLHISNMNQIRKFFVTFSVASTKLSNRLPDSNSTLFWLLRKFLRCNTSTPLH